MKRQSLSDRRRPPRGARKLGLVRARLAIVLALAAGGGLLAFPRPPAAPVARIVAVADVHGASDRLAAILRQAGLIDAQQRWIGGKAVLVQTGDVTDRGTGVRAALDLLMALVPQAAAAGGRVYVVLGNHEVMNMLGETRDVTPEIFQTFVDADSEARLEKAMGAAKKLGDPSAADKTTWVAEHPPGLVEFRDAFKPSGRYGKWLRSKPILVEIDGTVFMHAGISPALTGASLEDIARKAKRELADWDAGVRWMGDRKLVVPTASLKEVATAALAELTRKNAAISRGGQPPEPDDIRALGLLQHLADIGASSLFHQDGPLWFRGYSTWTDEEGEAQMTALLAKYKVRRFVTGHTPQPGGRIRPRFDGRLHLIDTGMLGGRFYPEGRASALEIAGDRFTPIYVE